MSSTSDWVNEWVMSMNLTWLCLHSSRASLRLPLRMFSQPPKQDFHLNVIESEKSFQLKRNFTIDKMRNWMKFFIFTAATITRFPLRSRALHHKTCRRWWWRRYGRWTERKGRRVIRKSKFRNEKIGMIFHLYATTHNSPSPEQNFFPVLSLSTHRGSRWEIIRSASSGVGGKNFSSGGTLGCVVERAGCATSSVGWKSGTNLALERNCKRNEKYWKMKKRFKRTWAFNK